MITILCILLLILFIWSICLIKYCKKFTLVSSCHTKNKTNKSYKICDCKCYYLENLFFNNDFCVCNCHLNSY